MKAALYHRVSTLDQNPDLAATELAGAAHRLGYEVPPELDVRETGSGARNDRPGLRRVLDAARAGKIDAVLVWKMDRWGRSALDLLANIRHLESAGVRFIATSQGVDVKPGGDAMSRLLVTMLGAVSEFERDLVRERTRLGLARAKANGKRLGRRPGPRPDEARVRALREAGKTWGEIGKALGCHPATARRAGGALV
jgi:DNA invertase Pin-like site-specific DNA recombinase